jgi:DNA-binding response OmpR family regulator
MENTSADTTAHKSIVIIDDDTLLLGNLQEYFAERGYSVQIADTGEKGLEMILATHPSAILLDILLPMMSGMDILKVLQEKMPDLLQHVLLLSNSADMEHISEAIQYGVVNYVIKSDIGLPEMFQKVEEMAAKK